MSKALIRRFDLPEIGEVLIERRPNGDVRIADANGENCQLVTRAMTEEIALKILGAPEHEPVPALFARRLALARLAEDAAWQDFTLDETGGGSVSPCPPAGSAPSAPPLTASPLSQDETSASQRAAGRDPSRGGA